MKKHGDTDLKRTTTVVAVLGTSFLLSGCLVEQTVTDGSGQVIYQKPVVESPFESEQKKEADVQKRESELGW